MACADKGVGGICRPDITITYLDLAGSTSTQVRNGDVQLERTLIPYVYHRLDRIHSTSVRFEGTVGMLESAKGMGRQWIFGGIFLYQTARHTESALSLNFYVVD